MLGRSSGNHDWLLTTQAIAFLAVFVYATHATQAIAFEWKPGFILVSSSRRDTRQRGSDDKQMTTITRTRRSDVPITRMICGPTCNYKLLTLKCDRLSSEIDRCSMRLTHLLSLKFVWLSISFSNVWQYKIRFYKVVQVFRSVQQFTAKFEDDMIIRSSVVTHFEPGLYEAW